MLQFTGLYKATIALSKNQRIESERFTFAPNGKKSTPNGGLPHFIRRSVTSCANTYSSRYATFFEMQARPASIKIKADFVG
jgi:hypothetical protein